MSAVRARDVYRRLVEDLKDQVKKLELGLIGPKSQRFKNADDPQLSMHIVAQMLGRSGVEGEDAEKLAQELLATAEKEPHLAQRAMVPMALPLAAAKVKVKVKVVTATTTQRSIVDHASRPAGERLAQKSFTRSLSSVCLQK